VGQFLANQGIVGHLGVDFLCIQSHTSENRAEDWIINAIEINLRLTGTTHPMMTLRMLTDGYLDTKETGLYLTSGNTAFYYVSYDLAYHESFKRLIPLDLLEIFEQHELHFCHQKQTGVVFHMIGAISEFGTIGLTCIGKSREEAHAIYDRVYKVLVEEAEKDM
jgi:hypothetical protein